MIYSQTNSFRVIYKSRELKYYCVLLIKKILKRTKFLCLFLIKTFRDTNKIKTNVLIYSYIKITRPFLKMTAIANYCL